MRNPHIELDPRVLPGQAVIRGTSISVALIVRRIASGATLTDLLQAYPRLTREDVHAALAYTPGTVHAISPAQRQEVPPDAPPLERLVA